MHLAPAFLDIDKLGSSLLSGVLFGSAYALLALGLVIVYKGGKIFNFAQGEFGTVAAFVLFIVSVSPFGLPYWVGLILGLVAAVAMGLLVERLVVQPLAEAPRVTILVATAAVALGAIATQIYIGDATIRTLPPLIDGVYVVFNTAILKQQLMGLVVLAVLGGLLVFFFQFTDWGLAVLAASQEPTATNLCGANTKVISMLVWGFAGLLGGAAGLVLAPQASFTPGIITAQFLIFGFVAAVVGGMTSMPGAVLGGLILGLVQQLSQAYIDIVGVSQIAIFVLLLSVLALKPEGLLGKGV